MTKTNNLDVNKKLSPQSKQLLDELGTITTKAADLVPRLYKSLENDGLGNSEIFQMIKEKIDISRARLYELIPPESKRPYKKVHKLDNSNVQQLHNQRRLVVPEEPTIPPPSEVVREAEIVREPPKPVNESISIPEPQKIVKIFFDPAPIDRDRTQVFIIHFDKSTDKIKRYETVGRRSIGR